MKIELQKSGRRPAIGTRLNRHTERIISMKKMLSLLLAALLVLNFAGCGAKAPVAPETTAAATANPETTVPETVSAAFDIVDSVGRTVHFEKAADTCVTAAIQGGAFMTMCALFGEDVTQHLVAWDDGMATWKDWYEVFSKALPELASVKNVGSFKPDKLDVEAVIAIHPDVFICPIYYYNLEGMNDKIVPTLEQAGIPVVVVDYRQDQLEAHLHCMEIIGKIFGKEERAQELADFYKEQMELVFNKTDKLKAASTKAPVTNSPAPPGTICSGSALKFSPPPRRKSPATEARTAAFTRGSRSF